MSQYGPHDFVNLSWGTFLTKKYQPPFKKIQNKIKTNQPTNQNTLEKHKKPHHHWKKNPKHKPLPPKKNTKGKKTPQANNPKTTKKTPKALWSQNSF